MAVLDAPKNFRKPHLRKPGGVQIQAGEYWGLPNKYPVKSPYGGIVELWMRKKETVQA